MGGDSGLKFDGAHFIEGSAGGAFKNLIKLGGEVAGFVHLRLHIQLEARGRAQVD